MSEKEHYLYGTSSWIANSWWLIFSIEPLLCLLTCLYMTLLPKEYCADVIGPTIPYTKILPVVWQYAGVIFSAYVVTLGQLLWTPCYDPRERSLCFRFIQVGMGLGDIILIGVTIVQGFDHAMAIMTVIMASFWGGLRLWYLVRSPPVPFTSRVPSGRSPFFHSAPR